MRLMLNIAAMVFASSLGFGSVVLAADDGFGARFVDAAPSAFGDPIESEANYDAFAMDEATAEMLNDMMPASGEEEAEADLEHYKELEEGHADFDVEPEAAE